MTQGPDSTRPPTKTDLVGDFRVVVERVLDEGETDDPQVLEARTTGALVLVSGTGHRPAALDLALARRNQFRLEDCRLRDLDATLGSTG